MNTLADRALAVECLDCHQVGDSLDWYLTHARVNHPGVYGRGPILTDDMRIWTWVTPTRAT